MSDDNINQKNLEKDLKAKNLQNNLNKNKINKDNLEENYLEEDIKKLKDELVLQENKTNDYLELSKKIQADFENYKKRNIKENKQFIFLEKKKILIEFLNFRNTMCIANNNEKSIECKENINQLILNLDNILKRLNIKKIDCLNKDFDFNNSECICKTKVKDKNKIDKVIEVLEDGYLLNNKLIKPAKVIVGSMEE